MGFSITDGGPGVIGSAVIVIAITAGLIAAYFLLQVVRDAREKVIEEEDDEV